MVTKSNTSPLKERLDISSLQLAKLAGVVRLAKFLGIDTAYKKEGFRKQLQAADHAGDSKLGESVRAWVTCG